MVINGEPWFVGKDVAEVLGYRLARKALYDHVEDDDKKGVPIQNPLGGKQGMWMQKIKGGRDSRPQVKEDDKTSVLIQHSGSNYKSKTILINESGLYSLILSSKLPQTREFKRRVTSEVRRWAVIF